MSNSSPPKLPLCFFRWFCLQRLLKYIEGTWTFMLTALGAVIITLMVVRYQAIKAALMNQVNSLRSE